MKRWGWTLCLVLLVSGVNAQTLDQPVATIKLEKKSSLVSQKSFRDRIAALENAQGTKLDLATKRAVLQELITAELIRMDIELQGIRVTDDDLMKQFRASNPGVSDAQIRTEVEKQSGKPWDEAVVALRRQLANSRYFSQFPQAQEISKVTVSDQEVREYFEANTSMFTAPDMIRISHIFFDTKKKPKGTLAEIQKRADEALKKITSGQSTFEEIASSVSEDPSSSNTNGDIGFIPRTLESQVGQQLLSIFGKDFLNAVFALKKGEVSGVLTSNSGLHIVRVTQKTDRHFMTLDEAVYPGQEGTVRSAIRSKLQQSKVIAAQAKMVNDIGTDLRKKAVISTFEQNF